MYLLSKLRSFHIYQTEGECSYTPSFRDKCIQTIELFEPTGKLQHKHRRNCTALEEGGSSGQQRWGRGGTSVEQGQDRGRAGAEKG